MKGGRRSHHSAQDSFAPSPLSHLRSRTTRAPRRTRFAAVTLQGQRNGMGNTVHGELPMGLSPLQDDHCSGDNEGPPATDLWSGQPWVPRFSLEALEGEER